MATVLDKTLRREIAIDGRPFTLSISPVGLHLTPKGRRKGLEIEWKSLVSGDAAMAHALNASLHSDLRPAKAGMRVAPRGRKRKPPRPDS